MNTSPKMDDFRAFWKEQQKNLLQKNKEGMRPVDVGALTMGERVSNSKSGEDVYNMLIYSKGAYVLHMMEMLYFWAPGGGEPAFKHSMQTFVQEYSGKAATHGGLEGVDGADDAKGAGRARRRQIGLVLQRVGLWHGAAALYG